MRADLDHVPVRGRLPVKGHLSVGRHQVGGAGGPGEREPARDIVVVQVRLGHVGDPHPPFGGQREHPVDVALRVDHHRDLAVGGQVTPVTQRRRVDGQDLYRHRFLLLCRGCHATSARVPVTTGLPDRCQALVPPATDTASQPDLASHCAAWAERFPLAQITYTRRLRGSSPARAGSSPSGISRAPGTWPAMYSSGSRTSTTTAPSARAAARVPISASTAMTLSPPMSYTPAGICHRSSA